MSHTQFITLLTDFGLSDPYVGIMKGVIAQINPQATVIDLTHHIPPQNIAAGRFCLMNAYPYFPLGTIHIAVVDPGVGSNRRGIAIECASGFLVGPDNGLLTGVTQTLAVLTAVELMNPDYWRTPNPSTTFHGRDIFAAVGAHLANGVSLAQLGEAIAPETLVQLPLPTWTASDNGAEGCIQYIDGFGNLITNIPGSFVLGKTWALVVPDINRKSVTDQQSASFHHDSECLLIPSGQTYSDTELGKAIAFIGSHGWVEIAVNGGSARSQLQLNWGENVKVITQ